MSNVSIYEKNWIDLVFEDKNQVYGAYQLRQENPRTTLFAFIGGILFLLFSIGLWIFLSSFEVNPDSKPIEDDETVITLSNYHPPKTEVSKPKTTQPQSQSQAVPIQNLSHMVVTATSNVVENVPINNSIPTTQGTAPGTGIETPTTGNEGPALVITAPIIEDNSPVSPNELDRAPEYPGGIKKFREYVGDNFEKPSSNDDLESLSVIMSFVIEKDGSMSSIRALRSSDKNMEKEAIRVLKSLKVKWSPGYKDGKKMRTLYALPIKVAFQN